MLKGTEVKQAENDGCGWINKATAPTSTYCDGDMLTR